MLHIFSGYYRHFDKVFYVDREYSDSEDLVELINRDKVRIYVRRDVLQPFPQLGNVVEFDNELAAFYPEGWISGGVKAKFVKYDEYHRMVFRLPNGETFEVDSPFVKASISEVAATAEEVSPLQESDLSEQESRGRLLIRSSLYALAVAAILAFVLLIVVKVLNLPHLSISILHWLLGLPLILFTMIGISGVVTGLYELWQVRRANRVQGQPPK